MKESHSRMKTMRPLKADLHIHTAEDPLDRVGYTAQDLIIKAADERFDVLAITNHHSMTFNQDLFSFARERGVFLIPGIELTVKKRHVVILNPPRGKTFSDFASLLKWRRPETLIIAPHPYFPSTYSLNGYLLKHLNLFDALEYCHFYSPLINFNLKAIEVAQSYGFPLVGNSDAHFISQLGTTYSLIYAEKTLESIFSAIRNHRVKIVSRPLSSLEMGSIANRFLRMKLHTKIIKRRLRARPRVRRFIDQDSYRVTLSS